jgi:hypothetical protein
LGLTGRFPELHSAWFDFRYGWIVGPHERLLTGTHPF